MRLSYPSVDAIIELNRRAIETIKVRKADRHRVLSRKRIEIVLENTKHHKGDIYDKGVVLLRGLVEMPHSFDSGNRRTAFLATKSLLEMNGHPLLISGDARVLLGIRQHFYPDSDIKEWLKGNAIRKFERR